MKILDWKSLSEAERESALARPALETSAERSRAVADIIGRVREQGDAALLDFTRQFDGVALTTPRVDADELAAAEAACAPELLEAMDLAIETITAYHEAGRPQPFRVETAPGVVCERVIRPIRSVGLYVPAGSAPLPSTVLMLGVPARLAGCERVVLCCPPGSDGVDATVLAAARRVGIAEVFAVGGAHAVAAMAFGTETVPSCDKIFGPGNAWVTEAKQQVAQHPDGASIDMPAGPSEVLVIADDAAEAEWVAADLLSQAEHGADSQAILVTDSAALARRVIEAVERQLEELSRSAIARKSLAYARIIVVDDSEQAVAVSNRYAPEHLIVNTREPRALLPAIRCAGSVFLGPWSPESVGDYCSGTNHVLPTYGWARSVSGLGLAAFSTTISVQELSAEGLRRIGPAAEMLARAEGLTAHERAVSLRLASQEEPA